jgi:hypothetical protein
MPLQKDKAPEAYARRGFFMRNVCYLRNVN